MTTQPATLPASPDTVSGCTIPLAAMPSFHGDDLLCIADRHVDVAELADYLVRFTEPALIEEWGPDPYPICDDCYQKGQAIDMEYESPDGPWEIVRVLR